MRIEDIQQGLRALGARTEHQQRLLRDWVQCRPRDQGRRRPENYLPKTLRDGLPVIDEMLRYTSIVQHGLARVALQDVEIGGVTVRAGEGVVAHLASANRDEAMYVEPDHFDTQRESRFHVAFGSGSHVCIGAPLARAELQIVFDTVFRRLPDLRLAVPFDAVKYRLDHTFFSVSELMVEW